jgi:hypothetical protein
MKLIRRCLLAAGCLMLITSPATADIELADGKVSIGGQARVRYEFKNDTNFVAANDTRDFVITRIRPHFNIRPHEQVAVFFQPQFSAGWGETGGSATTVNSTTVGTTGATSGGLNDPVLGVHQGYILYSPTESFDLTIGRQELAYGNHLVVGNVGWSNIGRSFDALKMKFKGEDYWVDFFWSILNDQESGEGRGVAAGTSFGDAHFTGLYSSFDLGDYLQEVDLYALYRLDQTARPRPHSYATIGGRVKSKPNNWDYRFEGTGQVGKMGGANQRDFQIDAEAGYTWEDLHNLRLGLEGFVTSRNYNHLFPTAHKWLGYIDLFGRRNISGGVVHASIKPNDQWKLNLDAHTILRTKTSSGLATIGAAGGAQLAAAGGLGGTGASGSRFAGEEIDLMASYQPLKFIGFKAGFSAFIPVGFVKTNIGNNIPLFGWVQTVATF